MAHVETDIELQPLADSDLQVSEMDGALIVRPHTNKVPSSEWQALFKTAFQQSRNGLLNNSGLQCIGGNRLQYVTSTAPLPGGSTISERAHEGVKAVVAATNELGAKHNAEEDERHRQAVEQVQQRKAALEAAKKVMVGK
jgi:hypothetical protein